MSAGARIVLGVAMGGAIGCSAIIGTRDIFFDGDDAGTTTDDSGGPTTDGGGGNDGAPTDGGLVDVSSCGDTTSSPTNCGSCGHDCLGGGCEAGVCAPVKINGPGSGEPWAIALTADDVFYSDISGSTGTIYRLKKDGGGGPVPVASTTDPLVYDLEVDAERVYFTSGSFGNGGAVEMAPLDGGAKQTIAESAPGASDPRGLSLDANNVYWVNTDTPTDVKRAAKAANQTPATLAATETDPTVTYVDGTVMWWTSKSAGKLRRCTLPSCTDRYDLTTGLTDPDVLANNANRVFYNSGNSVLQIAKNALLGPGAVVATNQSLPVAIAADERNVYWINLGDYTKSFVDGDIRRCPVVTGAADCTSTPSGRGDVVAKPGANMARGIAIDANAVYWTEQQAGAVWRLAR